MNQLTKFLVNELVDGKSVTAIYGGGFKPPTKGHFDLVKTALKDFKDIDKFIIYVGGGVRDGIEQEQSLQVWDIYKELLPSKVQIEPSASPIGDILRYAKNHPDEKVYFVLGYREGREDDLQDVISRTKGVEDKYPNVEVRVIKTPAGDMSGTNARKALKKGDKEQFFTFLPDEIPANEKENIYNILEPTVFKEGSCGYDIDAKTGKKLDTPGGLEEGDPKTGTGKKPKGSSRRLYTDEDPNDTVKVKFSTKQDIIDTLSKTSFKSKSHARQSQIINLIHQRVRAAYERAKDPDVKRRLKTALDYAEQRKEASKDKTERLKKQNLNEQKQDMKFKLPKLNYSYSSLQPYIDKETMEEHFDKHFKGYTDKLNTELDEKSIKVDAEDQIQAIQIILGKYPKNDIIRNNGGGFYNHVLYFENMTPDYKAPSSKFKKMLEENFNSFSEFKEKFKEAGLKQFGSGWVFLIKKGDKLVIESYANQDNPYLDKNFKGEILIAMDVWEHSYYLKHKSQRGNYINDFFRVVDYKVAEDRLKEELITENVAPNHKGKSAPFGSGYNKVKENTISSIDILEKIAELTNYMREKGYNIDPVPSIELVDNDVDNAEEFLGKTAYYDPINKSITLYTYGRHPKDIVRSFSHEMIHHIQNLEGRLGDVSTTNTLEDDHVNDLEKEANLKGTMTFRNWTDSLQEDGQKTSNKNMDDYKKQNNPSGKVKDPFGLNQFARELAQGLEETLTEGRYDKLTNKLSSFAFELMKDGYDVGKKVVDELFVVGPADEDSDIISDDFEFDFVVQATYTDDTYEVDGGANAGYIKTGKDKEEIQPLLTVRFKIPKDIDWQTVSFDLKDVIRHELEHLTQDGANVRPGKEMEDDEFIRDMINADLLPKSDYFKLEKEIDSMLQGMYFKAKKSRKPFLAVIDDYLDKQPVNQEERKEILGLWAKRAKALGLPLLSSAYVKETSYLHDTGVEKKDEEMREKKYVIFCDMDGVLVDFDEGYKELTGVTTQHADSQGKNEFWSLFRDSLKNKDISERSYWANLDWMSDGKQLWDYISPYNPYVLTAPSVNFDIPFEERYKMENNESMQGKTEWVQRLPNMKKIYFRSAGRKADFAGPNKILIDDRKDTIDKWNANGGIGILHTSTANTIKQLQDLGL
jgi:Fe-Mn family superoxide dismutase